MALEWCLSMLSLLTCGIKGLLDIVRFIYPRSGILRLSTYIPNCFLVNKCSSQLLPVLVMLPVVLYLHV